MPYKKVYETAGQPPKYKTAEELQLAIDDYFRCVVENDDMATIPGLCYHIGFADRNSFYQYEKRNKKFFHVIKTARQRLEHGHLTKGRAMDIFVLKNHYGYVDKIETDLNVDGKLLNANINIDLPPEQAQQLFDDLLNA